MQYALLDERLMEGNETRVDRYGHSSEMKVIEEHREMVVQSFRRHEVQL